MYGNTPFAESSTPELTADQRKTLRSDLTSVAARTRELLPGEFVVGSELSQGNNGPRAMIAVQPPVGSVVSANYDLEGEVTESDREDIARGLAASAALQVKQALPENPTPTAQ